MPNLFIRAISVVRFKPSRAATPSVPQTRPAACFMAGATCSRLSGGALVQMRLELGTVDSSFLSPEPSFTFKSPASTCNAPPDERITARAITFWSSRTLPGQG